MKAVQIDTNLYCMVFRTNVDTSMKAARLSYILEHTPGIVRWNLDMEDWEHVLRLEFNQIDLPKLSSKLNQFGITFSEMDLW